MAGATAKEKSAAQGKLIQSGMGQSNYCLFLKYNRHIVMLMKQLRDGAQKLESIFYA